MALPLLGLRREAFAWWWATRSASKFWIHDLGSRIVLLVLANHMASRDYNDNNMEHRAISHVCLDPAGPEVHELPQAACKEQRSQTYFPSCWNGRDLDSPNHKDHVSEP